LGEQLAVSGKQIPVILFETKNMKPHNNLDAWKLSFQFVKEVYIAAAGFPSEEKFGIISQIRRSGVSVPVNIAEGAARKSKREFLQFLYIAEGSVSELDTLPELSFVLNFCSEELINNLLLLLENISKRIFGLIKKIEAEL
jgi:four helix bundle protein